MPLTHQSTIKDLVYIKGSHNGNKRNKKPILHCRWFNWSRIKHPDYGWIPYTLDMSDEDNTIDNNKIKSMLDTMKVAEYVYPEVPQQDNKELEDIIGSLWKK